MCTFEPSVTSSLHLAPAVLCSVCSSRPRCPLSHTSLQTANTASAAGVSPMLQCQTPQCCVFKQLSQSLLSGGNLSWNELPQQFVGQKVHLGEMHALNPRWWRRDWDLNEAVFKRGVHLALPTKWARSLVTVDSMIDGDDGDDDERDNHLQLWEAGNLDFFVWMC